MYIYELFLILMDNTELFFQKGFDYLKIYVKWVLNRLKIPLKSTFTDLSYIFTFFVYIVRNNGFFGG
mgnify:FL=1